MAFHLSSVSPLTSLLGIRMLMCPKQTSWFPPASTRTWHQPVFLSSTMGLDAWAKSLSFPWWFYSHSFTTHIQLISKSAGSNFKILIYPNQSTSCNLYCYQHKPSQQWLYTVTLESISKQCCLIATQWISLPLPIQQPSKAFCHLALIYFSGPLSNLSHPLTFSFC